MFIVKRISEECEIYIKNLTITKCIYEKNVEMHYQLLLISKIIFMKLEENNGNDNFRVF